MAKKGDSKKQLKEIYRQGNDRISLALKLFGHTTQTSPAVLHAKNEHDSFRNLIQSIHDSLHYEENPEYRTPILQVTKWVLSAYTTQYIEATKGSSTSCFYAIRRCLDFLHLILYRDLRRKQKSSAESQAFFELQTLLNQFPLPQSSFSHDHEAAKSKSGEPPN